MQTQSVDTQNSTKPLISFIITYHNEPLEMLSECLKSVFALPLLTQEREIILLDDGSEVSPESHLEKYKDSIHYLWQPQQGLSQARNHAMEVSKGDFVQFIDADDTLIPSQYEYCLGLIKSKTPDIIFFNGIHKKKENKALIYMGPLSGAEYMAHNNLKAPAWGYVFRKTLLSGLKFTKGILHEDEEFTPKLLLRAKKVLITNANAYFYRIRKNSITHKEDRAWAIKRLNDTERIIGELQRYSKQLSGGDKMALQRRVAQLTMDYIYNIITLTHDRQYLDATIKRMAENDLFPLPDERYTKKYMVFKMLINRKFGRKLLMLIMCKK